ncbi:hypothetical protein PL321_04005 [Caloramator sp. mosi_1]|uniref:hypothetical protein n=1 Tax=Caloramator sp. mosi_1 TaxID=3023090 RepID=UPI00235F0FC5|nr:hypothetical protein [Caloramator sp. mosi_1]WDC84797.1 hypothetical protein PL321_04005 [Caloramator sp. mosi_1]
MEQIVKKTQQKIFVIISIILLTSIATLAAINATDILRNWYLSEFNNSTQKLVQNMKTNSIMTCLKKWRLHLKQ